MCYCEKNKRICTPTLSAGLNWRDIGSAFTDPEKRLNFPIKPIETKIELTPGTKATIIGAAALLAIGLIALSRR